VQLAVDEENVLKKVTIRKLVVDRETVKTLLIQGPDGRLRDVQGGAAPVIAPDGPSKWACSEQPRCISITLCPDWP
jgi:hypothetical protein